MPHVSMMSFILLSFRGIVYLALNRRRRSGNRLALLRIPGTWLRALGRRGGGGPRVFFFEANSKQARERDRETERETLVARARGGGGAPALSLVCAEEERVSIE